MVKYNIDEYIGKIYNNLTVIEEFGKNKFGHTLCKFKCNCGKDKIAALAGVKSGHIKSCGCLIEGNSRPRRHDIVYAEFLVIKRSNSGRGNRRKAGPYEWYLSFEKFSELIFQNCFYCNSEPSTKSKHRGKIFFLRNGLDRINNEIGYTDENCVPCCKKCNFMKASLNYNEFIEQCIKIVELQKKNQNDNN